MRNSYDVAGYCPMGCGQTLHLWAMGEIQCTAPDCPDRDAVTKLLSDPESDHRVRINEHDYIVKHPLRERIDGGLFNCSLHDRINLGPSDIEPGEYRVISNGDVVTWEEIV